MMSFIGRNNKTEPPPEIPPLLEAIPTEAEVYAQALAKEHARNQLISQLRAECDKQRIAYEVAETLRRKLEEENAYIRHVNEELKALFIRLDDRVTNSTHVFLDTRKDMQETFKRLENFDVEVARATTAKEAATNNAMAVTIDEGAPPPSIITRGPAVQT